MKRLLRQFRYGEKGFTLIELLVVIAILGILAAIIVPNFGKFFGAGQTEACAMEEQMVETATMAYVAEIHACPTAVADLADYFESGVGELQGEYTFAGSYPNCTVSQDAGSCPKTE